tara:strand:+ start:443 stop:571 length:129 start_codon:yes stop_codon:yes gene_type:complete
LNIYTGYYKVEGTIKNEIEVIFAVLKTKKGEKKNGKRNVSSC